MQSERKRLLHLDEADQLVRAVHGVRGDVEFPRETVFAIGNRSDLEEGLPHVAVEDAPPAGEDPKKSLYQLNVRG